jgi:hypothetical protein
MWIRIDRPRGAGEGETHSGRNRENLAENKELIEKFIFKL